MRFKRRCFHNLCRDHSLKNVIQYVRSKAKVKNLLDEDLVAREKRVVNNPDKRVFWSFVNRRLSKDSDIKVIEHDGIEVYEPKIIANISTISLLQLIQIFLLFIQTN